MYGAPLRSPVYYVLTNNSVVTTNGHSHAHAHADPEEYDVMGRIQQLAMFLEAHFGDVELHVPDETESTEQTTEMAFIIRLDEAEAIIDLATMVKVFQILLTANCTKYLDRLLSVRKRH